MQLLLLKLGELEELSEVAPPNEVIKSERVSILSQLHAKARQEKQFWILKSCMTWLCKRESNTRNMIRDIQHENGDSLKFSRYQRSCV